MHISEYPRPQLNRDARQPLDGAWTHSFSDAATPNEVDWRRRYRLLCYQSGPLFRCRTGSSTPLEPPSPTSIRRDSRQSEGGEVTAQALPSQHRNR
jgi:hypothetical protein